ncbi:MAG: ribosome biogenesis GTP-binding protein YihA/YsxC [Oligoflexus sp.]
MDTRYITSAAKAEQLPHYDQPELAFFGRSNTGKSTLLNALLGRRNLARQSRTPGRTQMINFFSVNNRLILADLPGYGYSEAKQTVAKNWQPLVDAYVLRPNIREFMFLLDCRRELAEDDINLMFFLAKQLPLRVILTKADKLSRSAVQQHMAKLSSQLKAADIAFHDIYPASSIKKTGIQRIWDEAVAPYCQSDQSM